MFKNNTMSGDMPARIKPHLALGIGENLDPFGIETIKASVREHGPMRGHEIMQTLDLMLAFKIAGSVRVGLIAHEEIAETGFYLRQQCVAVFAHEIELGAIQTGKTQPVEQATL